MKPQTWWTPGASQGLLSWAWAPVFVVPLPPLNRAERESSLRHRVQALVPSAEVPFSTRHLHHQGRHYGVVVVDRLPAQRPEGSALVVGVPLVLPANWPGECRLAVLTPDGWEVHHYRQGVLTQSFPPFTEGSDLAERILAQAEEEPLFWMDPTARLRTRPSWGSPAPIWPRGLAWGLPWLAPREPRWPWVTGALMMAVGLGALGWSAVQGLEVRQNQIRLWEARLGEARALSQPVVTSGQQDARRALGGVPLAQVFSTLAHAWPAGVEIRRLEIQADQVALTARAASALTAAARLAPLAFWSQVKVVQIRPLAQGEEFDMTGKWSYDR